MERKFCTGATNINNISSDENKNIVSLDKRRYIILCILGASLFCTGESFVTFGYGYTKNESSVTFSYCSTNNNKSAKSGHRSTKNESSDNSVTEKIAMDLFGIIFLMSYAAAAIVCPLIFKKIGLKWIILLGCSLNIFGVWLRIIYVSTQCRDNENNSMLMLVENIVLGYSMGLLSSLSTLVAISWFGKKEQDMSNHIPLISTTFGIGVGFMNIFIFNGYIYKAIQVRNYFLCQILWELVINALVILCAYLFIASEPRNSPIRSEMERRKNIQELSAVIKNKDDLYAEIKYMINVTKNIFSNKRSTLVIVISSINHGTYIVFFLFFHGVIDTFPDSKITFQFYAIVLSVILGLEIILLFICIKIKKLNSVSTLLTFVLFAIFVIPLTVYSCFFKKEKNSFNINAIIVLYISFIVLAPTSISFGLQNFGIYSYPSDPNIASSLVLSIGNLFGILLMVLLRFVSIRSSYIIFICLSVGIPSNIYFTLKRFVP